MPCGISAGGFLWTKVATSGRTASESQTIVDINVLMGHAPAKVDEKGRLKIPAGFRKVIEERYGLDCFITSADGQHAIVYPMPVWLDLQSRLAKVPSTSTARKKFAQRLAYYGQPAAIDGQGRVLVPAVLREVAAIADDVVVLGETDHLIVWNEERIQRQLNDSPLTADELKELELHGV